jgi:NAD(P)-dependent dehydrogenase (short-subunit alcohol dehydrogenase family)
MANPDRGQRKVAVITGGGSGIGLAMAMAFARAGYSLVIGGRNEARLKVAVDQIKSDQLKGIIPGVSAVPCDVRDPSSVSAFFAQFRKNHATLDVLINNAGVAHALAPVEQLPVETWKEVIDTNLTGTFLVTQAVLPIMQAGATIVNNLSIAATHPFAGMSAYNASKFGAMGFTKALREELRKKGIRVLALLPGAIDTEIWSQFWADAPREKMVSADTVAQAVLHAVSAPANATIEELQIGPTIGVL